jgi:hypothetical protein
MSWWGEGSWGDISWGDSTSWPNEDEDGAQLPIDIGDLHTIETTLQRIYKQWEGRQTWADLGEIFGRIFHEVETITGRIDRERYVGDAVGVQLEMLGEMVGRPRGALVDEELYRLAIVVDASTLFSKGTRREVRRIAKRLLGSSALYRDIFPAKFRLLATDITTEAYQLLLDIMQDVPPAGVGSVFSARSSATMGGWGSIYGSVDTPGVFGSIYGATTNTRSLWMSGRELGT